MISSSSSLAFCSFSSWNWPIDDEVNGNVKNQQIRSFFGWQPFLLDALVRPSAWLHSAQVPRCSNHCPETVRGSANCLGARLARYRQAEGVVGGCCMMLVQSWEKNINKISLT